jgi:hypothetical protein
MSTNSDKLDRVLELLESRSDLEEQVRSLRAEVKSLRESLNVHALSNHTVVTTYPAPDSTWPGVWRSPTVWSDTIGGVVTAAIEGLHN